MRLIKNIFPEIMWENLYTRGNTISYEKCGYNYFRRDFDYVANIRIIVHVGRRIGLYIYIYQDAQVHVIKYVLTEA